MERQRLRMRVSVRRTVIDVLEHCTDVRESTIAPYCAVVRLQLFVSSDRERIEKIQQIFVKFLPLRTLRAASALFAPIMVYCYLKVEAILSFFFAVNLLFYLERFSPNKLTENFAHCANYINSDDHFSFSSVR